jgi:mono/diheme cytochrome c family protein
MQVSENCIVPKDWVDGKENVTVEEWGHMNFESGHKTGQSTGIKKVVAYLMNKAADKFRVGLDEDAKNIRNLAREIQNDFSQFIQ